MMPALFNLYIADLESTDVVSVKVAPLAHLPPSRAPPAGQWHSFTQRGLAIKHVQLTIEI